MNEYICALHFEEPDSYKLSLEFNSMQHARRAAVEILGFLGLTYDPTTANYSAPEKEPADAIPNPAPENPRNPDPNAKFLSGTFCSHTGKSTGIPSVILQSFSE